MLPIRHPEKKTGPKPRSHRKPLNAASRLDRLQVHRRGLTAFHGDIVRDFLPLIQAAHACRLNRRDVNKDILAAILRHDETKTFCGIKPLDSADRHCCVAAPQTNPPHDRRTA